MIIELKKSICPDERGVAAAFTVDTAEAMIASRVGAENCRV